MTIAMQREHDHLRGPGSRPAPETATTSTNLPKKMLWIGLDIDDTVAAIKLRAVQQVNLEFGTNLTLADMKFPRLEQNVNGVNITEQDMKRILSNIWKDMESIPLVDDKVPEIVNRLYQRHHIAITTATDADDETLIRFLNKHKIPYDEIIHVPSSKEKMGLNHIDIFIDDYHEVADGAVKSGKAAILIKQPWNKLFRKRGVEHHHPNLIPSRMEHVEQAIAHLEPALLGALRV